jgi:hypothetical protein
MKPFRSAKKAINLVVGFAIIALIIWLFWRITRSIWLQFVQLRPEIAVGLVTASATILAATATIVIGRMYDRRREIESHFRARKVEIYDEFQKELSRVFHSKTSETVSLTDFLRDWQRKMIVWGGSSVLLRYITWMKYLQRMPANAEGFFKMGDLFLEMRKDVGLSNRGISRHTFAHTMLRNSDLLLAMAKENPNVTLAEVIEMEKKLGLVEKH